MGSDSNGSDKVFEGLGMIYVSNRTGPALQLSEFLNSGA